MCNWKSIVEGYMLARALVFRLDLKQMWKTQNIIRRKASFLHHFIFCAKGSRIRALEA